MNKNIIVTGGLGFIGSNLIDLLLKKKYNVINIDKVNYSSNFYNTKKFIKNSNYRFLKSDIGNKKKIRSVLYKYKPIGIFNLAAETHVDRSIDNPLNFINSNIISLFNFIEEFKNFYSQNKKTKFIHISTDEVYGDVLKGRSNENSQYKPSSPYAASKASSDHLLYSYFRTFDLPIIITNCSNNYGPNQHPEKLIPKLIYNILNNLPLPIYGDGKNSREWIYVTDHCQALLKVFKKGRTGENYNIGSNQNFNNLRISKILLDIARRDISIGPKVKLKFIKDRPGHDKRYALNSNKIKNKLKWSSKTKIMEGLKSTFRWYLKNKSYFNSIKKVDIIKRLGQK